MNFKEIFKKEPGNFIQPSQRAAAGTLISMLIIFTVTVVIFPYQNIFQLFVTLFYSFFSYIVSCIIFNKDCSNEELKIMNQNNHDKKYIIKKETIESYLFRFQNEDKNHAQKLKEILSHSELNNKNNEPNNN